MATLAPVLREDPGARFEGGPLRRRLVSGRRAFRAVSRGVHRAILREQEERPVPVAQDGRRTWWMFQGRFHWEDEGLEADEVHALPEDVRREVFRRDGGRCVACGSDELLQFDHVIPVAMGGASTPENLQLLCAPCNRDKGASL